MWEVQSGGAARESPHYGVFRARMASISRTRRRARARREGAKAEINMNSLIDLTFILLVVFIVTLPTLEQSIHVLLPVGKTQKAQNDKKKVFSITVDSIGKLFVGDAPVTMENLKGMLSKAVADDPELSVLVRGDVRVGYGDVYEVVKAAKDANVRHLGLVSREN